MSESFEQLLARINAERDAKIAAAHGGLSASLKKLKADRDAAVRLQPTRGTPNRPSWFSDWMPTPPSWLVGLFESKADLKPLAREAGEYGRVYGSGIKDGRGYGPYGAGYTMREPALPFGPNGEKLSADYDFQGSALNWRPPKKVLPGYTATFERGATTMSGLDCLGAEMIGFDYMNLAKAGTGLLQGYGGLLSDQGNPQAAAQAEKQKQLEEERRKAEKTASNLKLGLGIGGGVLLAIGAAALIARR